MRTPVDISITQYAFERAEERLSWNRATTERMAAIAFAKGTCHGETRGRMNRYLSKQYLTRSQGDNIRLYGEHVFIFEGAKLITVFPIPRNLRNAYKALRK